MNSYREAALNTLAIIAIFGTITLLTLAFFRQMRPYRWLQVEREMYARWSRLTPELKIAALRLVKPDLTPPTGAAPEALDQAFQVYLQELRKEHLTINSLDHDDLRLHLNSLVPHSA